MGIGGWMGWRGVMLSGVELGLIVGWGECLVWELK